MFPRGEQLWKCLNRLRLLDGLTSSNNNKIPTIRGSLILSSVPHALKLLTLNRELLTGEDVKTHISIWRHYLFYKKLQVQGNFEKKSPLAHNICSKISRGTTKRLNAWPNNLYLITWPELLLRKQLWCDAVESQGYNLKIMSILHF